MVGERAGRDLVRGVGGATVSSSNESRLGDGIGDDDVPRGPAAWLAAAKSGLFGLLFVMVKDASISRAWVLFDFIVDFGQLLAYAFNANSDVFPWNETQSLWLQRILKIFLFETYIDEIRAVFYVAVGVLAALLAAAGTVAWSFSRKRHQMLWLVKLLRTMSTLVSTIFFMPLLGILANRLACDSGSTGCWAGIDLFEKILAICVGLLFIALALLNAICFSEPDPASMSVLARPHSRIDLYYVLVRAVVTIVFPLVHNGWILASILLWCAASAGFLFAWYQPYYRTFYSTIQAVYLAIVTWCALCLYVTLVAKPLGDNQAFVFFLAGAPLVPFPVLAGMRYRRKRLVAASWTSVASSSMDLELKVRLQLKRSGMLYERVEYSGEKAKLAAELNTHFREAAGRKDASALVHVFWSNHLQYAMGNKQLALAVLQAAEECSPRLDEEFFIYRRRKIAEDEQSGGRGDVVTFLAYQKHLAQATESDVEATRAQVRFWEELLKPQPSPAALNRVARRIGTYISTANKAYRALLKLNPNAPQTLRMYAGFLMGVVNDEPSANILLERAIELDEFAAASKGASTTTRFAEGLSSVLMDDRAAIVTVSGDRGHEGAVLEMNASACRLLGYRQREISGRNVSAIIPAPFGMAHPSYIRRYLETGSKWMVDGTTQLCVLHKSGYAVPVTMHVRQVCSPKGGIIFLAVMVADESQTDADVLVVDGNTGGVVTCTPSCASLLGTSVDELERSKPAVSATRFFPDFPAEIAAGLEVERTSTWQTQLEVNTTSGRVRATAFITSIASTEGQRCLYVRLARSEAAQEEEGRGAFSGKEQPQLNLPGDVAAARTSPRFARERPPTYRGSPRGSPRMPDLVPLPATKTVQFSTTETVGEYVDADAIELEEIEREAGNPDNAVMYHSPDMAMTPPMSWETAPAPPLPAEETPDAKFETSSSSSGVSSSLAPIRRLRQSILNGRSGDSGHGLGYLRTALSFALFLTTVGLIVLAAGGTSLANKEVHAYSHDVSRSVMASQLLGLTLEVIDVTRLLVMYSSGAYRFYNESALREQLSDACSNLDSLHHELASYYASMPAALAQLYAVPSIDTVFLSKGNSSNRLYNMWDLVDVFSAKAGVLAISPLETAVESDPLVWFITKNGVANIVPMLMTASHLYERQAHAQEANTVDVERKIFITSLAFSLGIAVAVLVPLLALVERAQTRVIWLFLTLRRNTLRSLADAGKRRLEARESMEDDYDYGPTQAQAPSGDAAEDGDVIGEGETAHNQAQSQKSHNFVHRETVRPRAVMRRERAALFFVNQRHALLRIAALVVAAVVFFCVMHAKIDSFMAAREESARDIQTSSKREYATGISFVLLREMVFDTTPDELSKHTKQVYEALDLARTTHAALLYGNATMQIAGSAADSRFRDLMYYDACSDTLPPDCRTFADGLMANGLSSALLSYLDDVEELVDDADTLPNDPVVEHAFFNSERFTTMEALQHFYLRPALDYATSLYMSTLSEDVGATLDQRMAAAIAFSCVVGVLYVGLLFPLSRRAAKDARRMRALLLSVPPDMLMMPSFAAVVEEYTKESRMRR